MRGYDDRLADNEPSRAQLEEQIADLAREVERLTHHLEDAREDLRVEREDRARTLAALRDMQGYAERVPGAAYGHAADIVERGGR